MISIKDSVMEHGHSFSSGRELFRHREYLMQSGRVCHSVSKRLDPQLNATLLIATFDGLKQNQNPIAEHFNLWTETLISSSDELISIAYKERELTRLVNLEYSVGRIVVLTYADGVSDLIVVAHRARTDLAVLHQIIMLLTEGTPSSLPLVSEYDSRAAVAVAQQDLAWGCGNHRYINRSACIPIEKIKTSKKNAFEHVLAAIGVLLSRYGAKNSQIAILHSQSCSAHELKSASFNVSEEPTLAEFLDAAFHTSPMLLTVGSALPTIGVVFTEVRNDIHYIACFGPLFPLTFVWNDGPDGYLTGHLWYDEAYIHSEIAAQIVRHIHLLAQHIEHKAVDSKVSEIILLTNPEVTAIVEVGRSSAVTHMENSTIHGLFEILAANQPNMPAVSDETETISYRELNRRSEELAAGLSAYGVRCGDRVGVCLDRKVDLVVTLLSILKAGATYVPMDAKYPRERLLFTIADAQLSLVVSDDEEFPATDNVSILTPKNIRLLSQDGYRAESNVQSSDAAYVIYTSGSTGQPKGVVIPHQNIASLIAATKDEMSLTCEDTWTLFHSSAFDFSVWEIWGCLLTGGHLLMVSYWVSRSPEEFYELLIKHRVTVLNQTPSAFSTLQAVDKQRGEQLSLRLVIFGGEALDVKTLGAWFRRHPSSICQLINMYGITETTVHVTRQVLMPTHVQSHSKSVGKALAGWSISVRDKLGRIQPFGVPGEIYVGGVSLAKEYLGRAELTHERFILDNITGERVYRSGDLGRLHPDGILDHLGRIDSQVKIRGFRIELDEIRSVILNNSGVHAAVVLLNQGKEGDAASVQIDAYVVLQESTTIDIVRRRIAQYLPEYMMPSSFTSISKLPVTANGKLDVNELEKSKIAQQGELATINNISQDMEDILEHKMLAVWQKVLGRHVLLDDDFFESGGNSLMAVNLSAELRKLDLGPISLRDLFQHATPAALCALIKSRQNTMGV